jgi:hypothetical protein
MSESSFASPTFGSKKFWFQRARSRALLLVASRPVRDDPRVGVADLGVAHAEGREDPLLGKVAQRLPARLLDDEREQVVTGVAVEVLLAGGEIRGLLPGHDLEHVRLRGEVLLHQAMEAHQLDVVAQAAGVVEQVP